MKSTMYLVAFALCFAVVSSQTYVTSFPYEGLELIFNNQTSFMDQIGWFNGSLYVSGAGYIHQIQDKPFELSYNPWFENWRPYLSFDAFMDPKGNSWIFGPVTNQMEGNNSRTGLVYPIQITGRPAGSSSIRLAKQEYLSEDFIPAACAWGNTTTDKHSGYFVGWTLDNNGTSARFSLVRTVINTENVAAGGTVFEFNPYYNLVVLHNEGYTAYNRDYKPWIFHSSYAGIAVIVDPASFAVYKVITPADPNQHLIYNPAQYPDPNAGKHQVHRSELVGEQYQITSATYDYANEHVYVGVAAWGLYPGRILIIDVRTMNQYGFIDMGVSEGNPIAMDFDVRGPGRTPSFLYVAFFGLHHIAKYALTGPSNHAPVGYVTLPPSLNSVYRIANYDGFIHFVTNEQFGKVGRVPLNNFCPKICDTWNFGYCLNGRCACGKAGTELKEDNRCEIVVKTDTKIIEKEKEEHHGEVALGILFALTFILAAVGWYLYYKARGGRSPLENSGLLQR